MLGSREQGGAGIVGDGDRQCAPAARRNAGGAGEGRATTGGNGDADVAGPDAVRSDCRRAGPGIVFGAFDRTGQRLHTAGDGENQAIGGPTESRRQFDPILDAEPCGCAGAGIDETA